MSVNVQVIGPQPAGLYGLGRDLGDARAVYAPLVDKAKDGLQFLLDDCGSVNVVTSGSRGAPQLGFWAANAIRREGGDVRLTVLAPFPGQESRWPEDGLFGRRMYRKMLSVADEVSCATDALTPDAVARQFARAARLCPVTVYIAPCDESGGPAVTDIEQLLAAQEAGSRVLLV